MDNIYQKILLFCLIFGLILLSGCFRTKQIFKETNLKITEQKYYETADLKIPLPAQMFVSEENESVIIYHLTETFSHIDFCDFQGNSLPTTTFNDFRIKLSFVKSTLDKAVLKYEGSYFREFINADGTLKESDGFIEKVKIKNFEGYKISIGVEGCGYEQYYFPTNKGILVIQKKLIPELTDLNPQKEKFLNSPGVISPDKAQQIFEEIIKSLIIK